MRNGALFTAALALSAVPAGAGDVTGSHFVKLRRAVTSQGAAAALTAPDRLAVIEELRLERALWQDEVAYQRQRLDGRSERETRAALERLASLDLEIAAVLDALDASAKGGGPLDTMALERVLAGPVCSAITPSTPS